MTQKPNLWKQVNTKYLTSYKLLGISLVKSDHGGRTSDIKNYGLHNIQNINDILNAIFRNNKRVTGIIM
jgi:hypothetical protein